MLKTRVVTACFLVAIFLVSLFVLPPLWFSAFIGIVLLLAAWEWANLSNLQDKLQKTIYCIGFSIIMCALWVYVSTLSQPKNLEQTFVFSILLTAGLWWAIALLWVQGYPSSVVLWGSRWIRAIIGVLVLVPVWLAFIFLQSQPQGAWLILLVVLVVAAADTGAYFFGRAFGRHKLAQSVSPGKSWEGVAGGLLCSIILALAVAAWTGFASWPVLLSIILPTAMVSVLGDLLESMVKRHRGIKDSGKLLPGHGGVLDRIDGLTAAAPVFALALILSGWQLPQ